MLSGETAVGQYPFEAVKMMDQIARFTEASLTYRHSIEVAQAKGGGTQDAMTKAIAQATCDVAADLNAAAIVTATSSGTTAVAVSRHRIHVPIIAPTTRFDTFQRLALVWGVKPMMIDEVSDSDEMVKSSVEAAISSGAAKEDDIVVVTGGVPVNIPGSTNFLKVHRVGQPFSS